MKLKTFMRFICICLLSFILSSCNLIGFVTSSSSSEPIQLKEYAGQNITLKMLNEASEIVSLDSTGHQNILVLPVCFKDFSLEFLGLKEEEVISNLNKAFFGKEEETGWESVSSFYEKSSYSNLHINGEVAPVYTIDKTLIEVSKLTSSERGYDPSFYLLDNAFNNFKENYKGDISKFDANKDGYIDGIWVIYLNPYYHTTTEKYYSKINPTYNLPSIKNSVSSLLWAYTYWKYGSVQNDKSPNPFCYSFASYSFLWDGGYKNEEGQSLVDAHTYIHETGHLLGLDDYYNYDYSSKSPISPTGGVDMMDNNVGDHNSYSKYLLNWIAPKLVKEEGTYHLTSFSENGDCLLLPANISTYNNSPFDEYLLFEFYTPTSLNELDSLAPYDNGVQMLTDYGVRIYHVDSRLIVLKYDFFSGTFLNHGYSSSFVLDEYEYSIIGASNTPSYSQTDKILINMLSNENNQRNYYYQDKEDGIASNECLFKKGSKIKNFTFNNGSKLNYLIEISSLDENGVDITFSLVSEALDV